MHDVLERLSHLKEIPSVPRNALLPAMIAVISKGRRGATAVVDANGRLAGIVTDGDLRRAMTDRAVFEMSADDIMTPNTR